MASGILNAARQSGGALGVALLGSLLGSGPGHGQALNLHVPLLVATAGHDRVSGRRRRHRTRTDPVRLTARTIQKIDAERMMPRAATPADD